MRNSPIMYHLSDEMINPLKLLQFLFAKINSLLHDLVT